MGIDVNSKLILLWQLALGELYWKKRLFCLERLYGIKKAELVEG